MSPKDASECLLSCIIQQYYLFLNQDPKLRECKFINKHPFSPHFCIFTAYLKHIIQALSSPTLNVSCCQREMGEEVLLKLMDHVTLQVVTNFHHFAVQRVFPLFN